MNPKELADDLYVLPQIGTGDLDQLSRLGFRSIISNRPDAEAEDQPTFSEISREAHRNGMEVRYIPVIANQIGDEDISAFRSALRALPKPILAYCRTGTRSTYLWALSEASRRPIDEIASRASSAGYDLKNIEMRLQAIHASYQPNKVEG